METAEAIRKGAIRQRAYELDNELGLLGAMLDEDELKPLEPKDSIELCRNAKDRQTQRRIYGEHLLYHLQTQFPELDPRGKSLVDYYCISTATAGNGMGRFVKRALSGNRIGHREAIIIDVTKFTLDFHDHHARSLPTEGDVIVYDRRLMGQIEPIAEELNEKAHTAYRVKSKPQFP